MRFPKTRTRKRLDKIEEELGLDREPRPYRSIFGPESRMDDIEREVENLSRDLTTEVEEAVDDAMREMQRNLDELRDELEEDEPDAQAD